MVGEGLIPKRYSFSWVSGSLDAMQGISEFPLMEEEILVLRERGFLLFNMHRSFYEKMVKRVIGTLNPLLVEEKGDRIVVKFGSEEGEEFRAWLLLNLNKGFYITELDSLEL